MNRTLIKHIRSNLDTYENELVTALESFSYKKERYGIDYSIAVGATLVDIDMKPFEKSIRKTDKFIYLDSSVCAIVFDFNDSEQGIKAASKMLTKFEMQFFSNKIFLGIINSEDETNVEQQVKKLFETLCYGITSGMSNMPLDYQHIDSLKSAV